MQRNKHFETIALTSLDNGFYVALLTDFRDMIVVITPEKLGLTDYMVLLDKDLTKLQDYVARSFKFSESEEIILLDTR